ncbi:Uncharacterised protein [Bordetella pertussis]|nr:Uncharacterised protein [Bordetella pertussis]
MHIGKQRIAADGGQFLRMQQRTQAGQRLIRDIRMPVFAGVAQADRRAVLDDVGHHQDFRVMRKVELMQHMDHQAAEAAAEIDVLPGRDALVAKHHQVMIQVRTAHAGKIGGTQRTRQVDADDLRAQRVVQRPDREVLGRAVREHVGRESDGRLAQCVGMGHGTAPCSGAIHYENAQALYQRFNRPLHKAWCHMPLPAICI